MKLKIPAENAIKILQDRLVELESAWRDIDAWKSRTQLDVESIFGPGTHVVNVIAVSTSNYLNKGGDKVRERFRQLITSYVEYIREYGAIEAEDLTKKENMYENKYRVLLKEWNEFAPQYNKLLKDHEELEEKYDLITAEFRDYKNENPHTVTITKKRKILFLGANPKDSTRLRLDEEIRDIEIGLRLANERDSFEIKQKWAVTPKLLYQAMLDESPSIVHFSGHGEDTGIALEDNIGNIKMVETAALKDLFSLYKGAVECILLNSCYSEPQAKEIAEHIPYVIGMKTSVDDKVAILFSTGFYTALGAGKDIELAFKLALSLVKLEGISGSDIPVLLKTNY